MPVTRFPVVHKFGIISHSQHLDLQNRLLQQSYLQNLKSRHVQVSQRNPYEISEEFVHRYNSAETFEDRQHYEQIARKMLERSKRRAGVRNSGLGHHVNLPLAWTELMQISQCKGQMQEECLDVLITSLDISPLARYHIPALFFVSESILYWLTSDAMLQPYLRTLEIKLLKIGQLVFQRLFYHHMIGQLQGYTQLKSRLSVYSQGLQESQEVYNPHPSALLSIRFITEVSKIILADSIVEAKEGDQEAHVPQCNTQELEMMTKEILEHELQPHTSADGSLSHCVHDLSPTLWHALDVWRCTHSLGGGLPQALAALARCGLRLACETWVDGVVALNILAQAAKSNLAAMKVLVRLAQGIRSIDDLTSSLPSSRRSDSLKDDSDYEMFIKEPDLNHSDELHSRCSSELDEYYDQEKDKVDLSGADLSSLSKGHNARNTSALSQNYFRGEQDLYAAVANELDPIASQASKLGDAEIKSQMVESSRSDQLTSELNPTCQSKAAKSMSMPMPETLGLGGWYWEVALTYTDLLADICIHGVSTSIQKLALVGSDPCKQDSSAGLLNLAFFQPLNHSQEGGAEDWSWRIRYGALQALVRIVQSLDGDKTREGLRAAAWNALHQAQTSEKDGRVLEALKVGEVFTNVKYLLGKNPEGKLAVSLGSLIAAGLASAYLPPLPPPVEFHKATRSQPSPLKTHRTTPSFRPKPPRTSLKEELDLAMALRQSPVDYKTRTTFDLRRIVEDQWRKELQKTLSDGEEGRRQKIEEKQKEAELAEREKKINRAKKLHKSRKPSHQ